MTFHGGAFVIVVDCVEPQRVLGSEVVCHRAGPDGEARAVITMENSDAKHVEALLRERKITLRDIFECGLLEMLEKYGAN